MAERQIEDARRESGEERKGCALDTFLNLHQAIHEKEQACGTLCGHAFTFYPHALGWRGGEPYVLGLASRELEATGAEDGGWDWHWIRVADLEVRFTREAARKEFPCDRRPALNFLTHLFCAVD